MNESRILWLVIGVFVGFVVWGDARKRSLGTGGMPASAGPDGGPITPVSDYGDGLGASLPWNCGGCR